MTVEALTRDNAAQPVSYCWDIRPEDSKKDVTLRPEELHTYTALVARDRHYKLWSALSLVEPP